MKILALLAGLGVILVGVFFLVNQKTGEMPSPVETGNRMEEIVSTAPETSGQQEAFEGSNTVPLPQEEDVIRSFFALINEKRPADAISMMTTSLVGDDSSRQAWGVQFNAFQNISVASIEPSLKEDWMENIHTYKVTLTASLKPEAAQAPIPNYGWDEGKNIRWISLENVASVWKIAGIATGP